MSKKGFTLIEILIAVGVMGMLLGVTSYTFPTLLRNSRNQRREVDMERIRSALEKFKSDSATSTYPSNLNTLVPNYLPQAPADPRTTTPYPVATIYQPRQCLTPGAPGNICSDYQVFIPMEPTGTSYLVANKYTTQVSNTIPATPTPYPGYTAPLPTAFTVINPLGTVRQGNAASVPVLFIWNQSVNATTYGVNIQRYNGASWVNVAICTETNCSSNTDTTETSHRVNLTTSVTGIDYRWQVRAWNNTGGTWSTSGWRSFRLQRGNPNY